MGRQSSTGFALAARAANQLRISRQSSQPASHLPLEQLASFAFAARAASQLSICRQSSQPASHLPLEQLTSLALAARAASQLRIRRQISQPSSFGQPEQLASGSHSIISLGLSVLEQLCYCRFPSQSEQLGNALLAAEQLSPGRQSSCLLWQLGSYLLAMVSQMRKTRQMLGITWTRQGVMPLYRPATPSRLTKDINRSRGRLRIRFQFKRIRTKLLANSDQDSTPSNNLNKFI